MAENVTLPGQKQHWELGVEFAGGGFGQIYQSVLADGSAVVIKVIPKQPGAARELLFENIASSPYIVPILDSGEWEEFYFLVMPRAEKSLRQYLEEAGGRLSSGAAVPILLDVAEALAHMESGVVHRDLKPDNVLLYQGRWCIADFGIARYAGATTAPDTRKYAFTPPYAAPEQWRYERTTSATDVYSFGIMAFELLEGRWPFAGPDSSDFREQHLAQAPPSLTNSPPSLASLINQCLFKSAQARPIPANILARLRVSQQTPSPASGKLQAANQQVVAKLAQQEAVVSAQRTVEEQRAELMGAARQSFRPLREMLIARILEAASTATVTEGLVLIVRLGDGTLTINPMRQVPSDALAGRYGAAPFDVVAYTTISVRQPRDRADYEGRSHSLWFCDAQDEGVYRWFELAFMVMPLIRERLTLEPFALDPTDEDAASAFWNGVATRQLDWEPIPVDQGEEEAFIDRWLNWFADATNKRLTHPPSMPEYSGGRHRKSV